MIISRSRITGSEGRAWLRLAEWVSTIYGRCALKLTGRSSDQGGGGGGRARNEPQAVAGNVCQQLFVMPEDAWTTSLSTLVLQVRRTEYRNFREGSRKHLLAWHRPSSLPTRSVSRYFLLFSVTMESGPWNPGS